jgi:hypothetical protein
MREHVIWTGDNFDEVSNFVTSGVKYSESTRITNGEKKENKLLFILDEDSNWVPVEEGSYIWKNDNDTFYITDDMPDDECDYEKDDDTDDDDDVVGCEDCAYKDTCEDYVSDDDDCCEELPSSDEPGYDYTEEQQKRIDFFKKELSELKAKLDKIYKFMSTRKWDELSDTRKMMLQGQRLAMDSYAFWLGKRLDWEKNLGE